MPSNDLVAASVWHRTTNVFALRCLEVLSSELRTLLYRELEVHLNVIQTLVQLW